MRENDKKQRKGNELPEKIDGKLDGSRENVETRVEQAF